MIPLFGSPPDLGKGFPESELAPPPSWFRPALSPRQVEIYFDQIPFPGGGKSKPSAAQQAGNRYEDKAQEWLKGLLGSCYCRAPVLRFLDDHGPRAAIPDGIILPFPGNSSRTLATEIRTVLQNPEWIIIVEIKISHMADSWYQLRQLYEPVLAALYPESRLLCCELCRSFDPAIQYPEEILRVDDPRELLATDGSRTGVLRWKP